MLALVEPLLDPPRAPCSPRGCDRPPRPAMAQGGLELPELHRLEAARGVEPVAERGERDRRHGLQDVHLRDQRLEDGQDALEGGEGHRPVVPLERAAQQLGLVEHLLEPELVDLVDDDEQHLVVLLAPRRLPGGRRLEVEQLVET